MENAAQTLGRLRAIAGVDADAVTIDLRAANLQGIDFEGGNFNRRAAERRAVAGGRPPHAQMQGQTSARADAGGKPVARANAGGNPLDAQMQGATSCAQMQGADLLHAQMQGANLGTREMQGATSHAQMQGATLFSSKFDAKTRLKC